MAIRIRDESADSTSRINTLRRRKEELLLDIPRAEANLQVSSEAREQWDDQWKLATKNLSGLETPHPGVIAARLDKLKEIRHQQRERKHHARTH